jgi:hypothetical protein
MGMALHLRFHMCQLTPLNVGHFRFSLGWVTSQLTLALSPMYPNAVPVFDV